MSKTDKALQRAAQKLVIKRDFAKRLSKALDYNKYPQHGRQTALAEEMDVSQNTTWNWLSGTNLPGKAKQIELAELLAVNLNWLSNGNGTMLGTNSKVRAGVLILDVSEIETWLADKATIEEGGPLLELPNPNQSLFAIKQTGDAMATLDSNSIPANAYIVIDAAYKKITPGERYLVRFGKYPNPICRLAKESDTGSIVFVSINPQGNRWDEYNPEVDMVYGQVKNVLL